MAFVHLFLAVLAILAKEVRCQCPNPLFQQTCYIIPHAEANWIGAVRYCQDVHGHLATVESAEEHNFIVNLIRSHNTVQNLTLNTPNEYKYHYLDHQGLNVYGHTSITFTVQACHDAHVALSAGPVSTKETYEVVIGGWSDSQSVIRDCMQCAHMDEVRQQDHPLDCNNPRPFWLSWQDGHIRLGTGLTVGENQMLSWQDPQPHAVNHVGISTGFGSSGVWHFSIGAYRPGVFWLGSTDLQVEGEWNSLPDMEEFAYTHWAQGQPSNAAFHHCAAMDGARGLDWIDANCQRRRNFICELCENCDEEN